MSHKYLGVVTNTDGATWVAHLDLAYRRIYIASFPTERDAAVARDRVALSLSKAGVVLNVPNDSRGPASVEEMRRWAQLLRKHRKRHSSRFLGVSRDDGRRERPWVAALWIGSRTVNLGCWSTELEAAEAHDRALLHYSHTLRYRLNFPRRVPKLVPADAATLRAEALRRYKQATSSRYIGVTWVRRKRCWAARLYAKGQIHSVGYFDREEEAAWKRDALAIKLLGGRARLNFHPETGDEVYGQRLEKLRMRRTRR